MIPITFDLKHCSCNLEDWDEVEPGTYQITITAEEGYILNGAVEITFNCWTHTYTTFQKENTVWEEEVNLQYAELKIRAEAVPIQKQASSFVNLYLVNNSILHDLSKKRFYSTGGDNIFDYANYIVNLLKIPFDIPENLVLNSSNIELGLFDSEVPAPVLYQNQVDIDLGLITIPEKYQNVYDYKNTSCILYLPYSEPVELRTEYVINQTLSVHYKIDLYSGNGTVNVTSTLTDQVIYTASVVLGTQIPFLYRLNDSVNNTLSYNLDNEIKTAFVEVTRNIPYNEYDKFGKPTVDFGRIGDYKGYLEVSRVELYNVCCSNQEKERIRSYLESGIFIHEETI